PAAVTAPIPSVVSAVVTNIKDDQNLGRVRVKIPRWDDTFDTGWLRVAQPGAGATQGALVLPEVDDEVLVAFENGDVRRGYVIGGLYNGVDKPTQPAAADTVGSDGKVAKRSFTSRKGHFTIYSDKDGDEFVQHATKDGKFSIKLAQDAEGGAVLITSKNLVKITADGDITITSKGNVHDHAPSQGQRRRRGHHGAALKGPGGNHRGPLAAGAEGPAPQPPGPRLGRAERRPDQGRRHRLARRRRRRQRQHPRRSREDQLT